MSTYKHLNREERNSIEQGLKRRESYEEIGRRIGRNRSTVWREHRRNGKWNRKLRVKDRGAFEAVLAERRAVDRHEHKQWQERKVRDELEQLVKEKLERGWSPEQISGRLKIEGSWQVSHESIYRYLVWDKSLGGKLYLYLRRAGRRRGSRYQRRSRFLSVGVERRSIHERPWAANFREELGHWERDLMMGKRGGSAVLAMVDRRSGYLVMSKVEGRASAHVNEVTFREFDERGIEVKTVTNDRGIEFADAGYLEKRLGSPVYYADAMASWQRGSVENVIGLVRQYFRKHESLDEVDNKILRQVEVEMNARPRKRHGYWTPEEIHFSSRKRLIGSEKF